MTTRTCPEPCGRPVGDGYLCARCTGDLYETLGHVPMWADQLGLVLARLTRYTDPSGRRNAAAALPFNPAASEAARRMDGVLRATARSLGAPGDVLTSRLGEVVAYVRANVFVLRTRPDAGTWFDLVTGAVETAVRVCDRPPEQWYAGACPECHRDLYPSVADDIVTCACGRTWGVAARRAELLAAVRDVVAPAPAIARALSSIGDNPVTQERLRQWRHRGRLQVRRMTTDPVTNWYRVGDVLDLLATEARRPTRAGARRP